jgi:hypothetical protein
MRRTRLTLKGAATDPATAARIWRISEEQAGIDPASSSVARIADGAEVRF